MKNRIDPFNEWIYLIENRISILLFSMIIGLAMLGISMILVAPSFKAAYHGLQYSLLSNDPLGFTIPNALQYRILPSLIGYFLFLRGELFFIVPLIFAWLFILSVYWVYRKKNFSPVHSILMAGLISFSCTIFIQLLAPGYTDVIFYFFIFLSFSFIHKPLLSAIFYSLALLTHESCLFLFPALILYSDYINKGGWIFLLKFIGLLILALLPLMLYRHWVSQHIAVEYDLEFYFSEKNIQFTRDKVLPHLSGGLFWTFKLFWIIPLIVIWKLLADKNYKLIVVLFTIFFCVSAQLFIAFDISRMLCLSFPIILISAEKIHEYWSEKSFTRFLFLVMVINFFIPSNFMSADGLIPMPSLQEVLLQK